MPPTLPITHADRARHALGLLGEGQHKAAERMFKDVLKNDPNQFEALLGSGVLAGMKGDDAGAVKFLSRAARRKPASDEAQYNLGQALIRLGRFKEAAEAIEAALKISEQPQFHEKLGDCLRQLGRLDEAASHFSRAVELAGPRAAGMLLSSLVEAKRRICDWDGLETFEGMLIDSVRRGDPVETLTLSYVTDDAELLRKNAVTYSTRFLPSQLPPQLQTPRFLHTPRDGRRIKIGYLCADFRAHAMSHLMAELFECHDKEHVEVFALSYGPDDKSPIRARLQMAFEHFVDLSGHRSSQIAERIHNLGIDILVDLMGYTNNARPEVLRARPAPVQTHYLAYPGTLGSPDVDYHIVDPVIAPTDAEAHFTEKLVRLPDSYQANDSKRESAVCPSRSQCGLPEGSVVFASFNNSIKISPNIFQTWMRVLAAVPRSVLWLFSDNGFAPAMLRSAAAQSGIDPERLIFAGYAKSDEHLARLQHADLLLDSFPYGAHTTASDALWMGVPVLTMTGRSFASRVGASLLSAVGMPELITVSPPHYEQAAIELARSPERLASLKARLVEARSTAPLFDTPRLARHLEAAYAEMWRLFCAGEQPQSFDVPRLP